MSSSDRRRRQIDELRDLCRRGAVRRAMDLAFEHFAHFGQDDSVVVLLEGVIDGSDRPDELRHRLAELRAIQR